MKALFEKIIPSDRGSFKAFSYMKDGFDTAWHYHPEFELTYILSSTGVRYVGNNFGNFEEDDLVLLGSNLPHCWKNTGIQRGKSSALVIHWDENLLGKDWLEKPEFSAIAALLEDSSRGIRFDKDVANSLREKFIAFLDMNSFDKLICFLEILQTLANSKGTHALCEQGFHDTLRNDDHERINTIYQFVRNHVDQKITLTAIAEKVHMGEESFSRFFSKAMGKPFFTFLNEYRINVACKLLIESDQQISQISYAAGFESLPFFYRQFKKYKQCSPGHYRTEYEKLI